jgi:hypothetical protein
MCTNSSLRVSAILPCGETYAHDEVRLGVGAGMSGCPSTSVRSAYWSPMDELIWSDPVSRGRVRLRRCALVVSVLLASAVRLIFAG